MSEPDIDALVQYALTVPETAKPTPLSQQAHIKHQERVAIGALEDVLRKNPDLREQCKRHRWFVEIVNRIEAAERAKRG